MFDSEAMRTLLRWRYEPTGAPEQTRIDLAVAADG
jgi:hypothetical protein